MKRKLRGCNDNENIMIRINDRHSMELIAQYAKVNLGARVESVAGYDDKDQLIGGVLILEDNGWSCEAHTAGFRPNWATKELLWTVFNYIFRVRKIKKLFGRVPENNYRARRFNRHLGFVEEHIIDDVYQGGEGLVVMSMYEDNCRYLKMKPPIVNFPSIEKTDIVKVYQYDQIYSQSNISEK